MSFLYIGLEDASGFMRAIGNKYGAEFTVVHQINNPRAPFEGIESVVLADEHDRIEGVVLVGEQWRIFDKEAKYLDFLTYVDEQGIRLAAVLNPVENLPRNNQGVDRIIRAGGGVSINSIATELHDYFTG